MRKFLLLSIFSLLFLSADAQIKKTLHKTYNIGEVDKISLDIVGEYEVLLWEGSTVLTQTTIELYDANLNIFKFFLKAGRYDIDMATEDSKVSFVSHDKVRRTITSQDKQCWEIIKTKIHIPSDFTIIDQTQMVRKQSTKDIEEKKETLSETTN